MASHRGWCVGHRTSIHSNWKLKEKDQSSNQYETYVCHHCCQRAPSRRFKRPQKSILFPNRRSWVVVVRSQPPLHLCGAFKTVKCWFLNITNTLVDMTKLNLLFTSARENPISQSCGGVSGKKGKVRIYWEIEVWFKAEALSTPWLD